MAVLGDEIIAEKTFLMQKATHDKGVS